MTGEGPWVMADSVQLEWMFLNLAANARDAMAWGGSLRIEVQHVTRGLEALVRVIVTDTGCGMDAATQAHLFEPSFITHQGAGQGTGLRLASVYEVVTQSHGEIRVTSEVGQGTSFTIDLPSATEPDEQVEEPGLQQTEPCETDPALIMEDAHAVRTVGRASCGTALASWQHKTDSNRIAPAADASKEEPPMTVETGIRTLRVLLGGPSVLVVDDEPSVRRLLGALLDGLGYRARLAADGVEARSIVETGEVSLILCDVHLRGESGQALVRDLLRQSPHTVALMMSGADESEPAHGAHEAGIYGHIAKPFDAKDVANQIAQALCGRRLGGAPAYGEDSFPWQRRREFTNA